MFTCCWSCRRHSHSRMSQKKCVEFQVNHQFHQIFNGQIFPEWKNAMRVIKRQLMANNFLGIICGTPFHPYQLLLVSFTDFPLKIKEICFFSSPAALVATEWGSFSFRMGSMSNSVPSHGGVANYSSWMESEKLFLQFSTHNNNTVVTRRNITNH